MNTSKDREEERVLELLVAINRQSDLSQRHLARHMGVALGLANSYLKRCVRKGLIKINGAPAHRYLYYLTPKGFAEKGRLTAKYLTTSFEFYRRAGASCVRVFDECQAKGWRRIILCGVSDLAEIAALRALEMDLSIVGTYDLGTEREQFLGRPVWREIKDPASFDTCVLTDLSMPRNNYERLVAEVGRERIMVPDILNL